MQKRIGGSILPSSDPTILPMDKPAFYILPGDSRLKDRIVPVGNLTIERYAPSKDLSLTAEDRLYRPNAFKVTVQGETTQVYPFVLPCSFRPEWANLEAAAQDMEIVLVPGDPVSDEDPLGHSIITSWLATADGCVYTARTPGCTDLLLTAMLPIRLDEEWIQEQMSEQSEEAPRG